MSPWVPCGVLALLAVSTAPALAAPATDSLEQRVAPCFACHGEAGRATPDGYYPRIAGKPAGYLQNQLRNFRDGRRANAVMTYLVERQRDDYLAEIARYFAGLHLPYPAPAPVDASAAQLARGEQLAMRGDAPRDVPACAACHGERLTGVAPAIPGLLGLPRDYLLGQLGAWQVGTRHAQVPDCMADVARALDGADVAAVTAWLALQPVPADARPAARAAAKAPRECGSVAP